MRTTLDIDDRVLALARSRARAEGRSIGTVVSELALRGHEAGLSSAARPGGGFPMLPPVPGHVITDAMVEAALAEDG